MQRKTLILLAIIGILITGYLTHSHYKPSAVICPADAALSCTQVLLSEQSKIGGIPVALIGLLAYSTILVLLLNREDKLLRWSIPAGVIAAGYFNATMLEIGSLCIWCEASHITMSALFFTHRGINPKSAGTFFALIIAGALLGTII
ncbi:hypothetical protein D6825_00580 [Candidatus Woesearchaeota archaeon]|nr:MAG: hypothetical protein D6825_00580 [Candidatus Woesearchaeota archaeon]